MLGNVNAVMGISQNRQLRAVACWPLPYIATSSAEIWGDLTLSKSPSSKGATTYKEEQLAPQGMTSPEVAMHKKGVQLSGSVTPEPVLSWGDQPCKKEVQFPSVGSPGPIWPRKSQSWKRGTQLPWSGCQGPFQTWETILEIGVDSASPSWLPKSCEALQKPAMEGGASPLALLPRVCLALWGTAAQSGYQGSSVMGMPAMEVREQLLGCSPDRPWRG